MRFLGILHICRRPPPQKKYHFFVVISLDLSGSVRPLDAYCTISDRVDLAGGNDPVYVCSSTEVDSIVRVDVQSSRFFFVSVAEPDTLRITDIVHGRSVAYRDTPNRAFVNKSERERGAAGTTHTCPSVFVGIQGQGNSGVLRLQAACPRPAGRGKRGRVRRSQQRGVMRSKRSRQRTGSGTKAEPWRKDGAPCNKRQRWSVVQGALVAPWTPVGQTQSQAQDCGKRATVRRGRHAEIRLCLCSGMCEGDDSCDHN